MWGVVECGLETRVRGRGGEEREGTVEQGGEDTGLGRRRRRSKHRTLLITRHNSGNGQLVWKSG